LAPELRYAGLAIVVIVAAAINTIAGGGSLLLLPVLIAFGLPLKVANGTLRIGVLVQSAAAALAFRGESIGDPKLALRISGPMILGAAVGSGLATQLADAWLQPIFGVVWAAWAVVLILRPGKFLAADAEGHTSVEPKLGTYLYAALIGVYGGFLQAAVGFPLLVLLVSGLGYSSIRANAIKVALVFAYTAVVLPIFIYFDQVAWVEGTVLALGSAVGGWLGTRIQIKRGANFVRWVVIISVGFSGVAMLVAGVQQLH
jgi:hypothetical protein